MQDLSLQSLEAIKNIVETVVDDKLRFATDLLRQENKAMEARILRHVDEKIDGAKREIVSGVGEVIDDSILTKIDDHETRMINLERQMKAA